MEKFEVEIEDSVVVWAQQNKFLTPKVRFAESGYPDRLFISPNGHTIFIEFKRLKKRPDNLQYYRIEQLTKRGVPAVYCDSKLEAINVLKACLEPETISKEGDQVASVTSIRGPTPRPRLGEDVDGPRYDQDTPGEGNDQAGAGDSPNSTDVLNVAGGDKEVE